MIRSDFTRLESDQAITGLAVWLDGQSFEDTSAIEPGFQRGDAPVCGPFLIERVLVRGINPREPRVIIVETATGYHRSMTCSWLLVPKEKSKC